MVTSASFGDNPTGNIAAVVLHKTAGMMKEEYPVASEVFLNNTYVDDIAHSVDNYV